MVDRIASDHPSIETIRATVTRHGGGHRLDLPPERGNSLPETGTIEVILEGSRRIGRVRMIDAQNAIVGIYETQAAATGEVDGTDALEDWLAANNRRVGSSVLLDVIESKARVGLRMPGESAVYVNTQPSSDGLADIARQYTDDQ